MSFYRSKEMQLFTLIMPRESAYDILNALGQLNTLHFVNANEEHNISDKLFHKYHKRSEETLNKISLIEQNLL